MDVYLDLIYFANALLGSLCFLSLSLLTGKLLSVKKIVALSFLWGFHVLSLYSEDVLFYLWVMMCSFLFQKKKWFFHSILLLFIHETYLNSLKGVYHIGNVLILTTDFQWVLPLLYSFVVIGLYMAFWFHVRKETLNQALYVSIKVKYLNQIIEATGFMDTGNQALYDGLPIVFTSHHLPFSKEVEIKRLLLKHEVPCIKANILYQQQWHPCWIARIDQLDVDADYLLNYYFM